MGGVQINIQRTTFLNTMVDKVVISHVGDEETFVKSGPTDTENGHATFTVSKVALYQNLIVCIVLDITYILPLGNIHHKCYIYHNIN